jgi:hypothetical protein
MIVIPHVYYRIEFPDFGLTTREKERTGRTCEFMDLPAAANIDPYHFKDISFLTSDEKEQKTTKELIKQVSSFAGKHNGIQSFAPNNVAGSRGIPTFNVRLYRNILVYLAGKSGDFNIFKSTVDIDYINGGKDNTFNFIYNKTDDLIYTSNIRKVLNHNFKHINLRKPGLFYPSVLYDHESQIDPKTPLFVYNYNDDAVFVEEIRDDAIVVNRQLFQMHPNATGQYPEKLLELLEHKKEIIDSIEQLNIVR